MLSKKGLTFLAAAEPEPSRGNRGNPERNHHDDNWSQIRIIIANRGRWSSARSSQRRQLSDKAGKVDIEFFCFDLIGVFSSIKRCPVHRGLSIRRKAIIGCHKR